MFKVKVLKQIIDYLLENNVENVQIYKILTDTIELHGNEFEIHIREHKSTPSLFIKKEGIKL